MKKLTTRRIYWSVALTMLLTVVTYPVRKFFINKDN